MPTSPRSSSVPGSTEPARRWQPAPRHRIAAGGVVLVLVLTLFHQGAQPYAVGLVPEPWDELAHMAVFAVIATLFWLMAQARRPWLVLLAVAAIAAADEWAQLSLPGRQAGLADLAADVAGAALALWCLSRLARGLPARWRGTGAR